MDEVILKLTLDEAKQLSSLITTLMEEYAEEMDGPTVDFAHEMVMTLSDQIVKFS
jgi:hypothetical protein